MRLPIPSCIQGGSCSAAEVSFGNVGSEIRNALEGLRSRVLVCTSYSSRMILSIRNRHSVVKQKNRARFLIARGFKDWFHDWLFSEMDLSPLADIPMEEQNEEEMDEIDRMLADDEAFAAWKQRSDAIEELRYYQQMGREPDSEDWEDWLDSSWARDSWYVPPSDTTEAELRNDREKIEMRFIKKQLQSSQRREGFFSQLFQEPPEVEEMNEFEKGFTKYAARSTATFLLCLLLIPWVVDFLVHDYVLVPFLKRYVDLVPLAAQTFDVRDSQKLRNVIPELHDFEAHLSFEAEVGITPPLSEEELQEHLHDKALELLEEVRQENRSNFANIFSDMVAGMTLTLLLIFNPLQVELMTFSGNRVLRNLSATGKAFFIILLSDTFFGYHSESGWEALVELFLEHYGIEAPVGGIAAFVAIVPVTIDAGFKLWVFRYLPRIAPSVGATFKEMTRH